MTRAWERLFIGNFRDADALAASNEHRITTVITVCEDTVRSRDESINYLHFPIADTRPVQSRQFSAVIAAIADNIGKGTVLIHCVGGSSRSPIITAAWMHIVGYRNIEDALVEIGKRRSIEPSPILLKSVMEHL